MSMKIYLITGLIALIAGGALAFIDYRISLGVILAAVFSIINLFMLSESMKKAMTSDASGFGLMMAGNVIRFALLFGMIFMAYKLPQLFSLTGVAIGLTLFIVALVIDALSKRKG